VEVVQVNGTKMPTKGNESNNQNDKVAGLGTKNNGSAGAVASDVRK